jgi:hypothetical protein
MRLTKAQEVRATYELLGILTTNHQGGGRGLRTSEMQGTRAFHGSNTLTLRQIDRLLRKTRKAVSTLCGSGRYTYNEWSLTQVPWIQNPKTTSGVMTNEFQVQRQKVDDRFPRG